MDERNANNDARGKKGEKKSLLKKADDPNQELTFHDVIDSNLGLIV